MTVIVGHVGTAAPETGIPPGPERVTDAATLRSLGLARISIGGSLARAALGFVERAGRDLLDRGSFERPTMV